MHKTTARRLSPYLPAALPPASPKSWNRIRCRKRISRRLRWPPFSTSLFMAVLACFAPRMRKTETSTSPVSVRTRPSATCVRLTATTQRAAQRWPAASAAILSTDHSAARRVHGAQSAGNSVISRGAARRNWRCPRRKWSARFAGRAITSTRPARSFGGASRTTPTRPAKCVRYRYFATAAAAKDTMAPSVG